MDPRLYATLSKRHGENFHKRSLIICSGLDMVNISCTNIIAKDVKTAQVDIERKKKNTAKNKDGALEMKNTKICLNFYI